MTDLTLETLGTIYKQPGGLVLKKVLSVVEKNGRAFIAKSPFCVVSSAGPDGSMDVSPRGGEPGFVHVSEDGKTLHLPDRPGNNRLDVIRNILSGSGHIGLMFIIPGIDDIFRVNGKASVSADPELLAGFEEFGKLPRSVIRIEVLEAYLHCPKALMRGRLWEAETYIDRDQLPSGAEMIFDQLDMGKVPVTNEQIIADYKTQL